MDVIHGDDTGIHLPDDQHHPIHVQHYMPEHDHGMHHLSNGGSLDEDHDEAATGEGMEGDVQADPGNLADGRSGLAVPAGGGDSQNQLTLSFQGQVFVYDSVSPEKLFFLCMVEVTRASKWGLKFRVITKEETRESRCRVIVKRSYNRRDKRKWVEHHSHSISISN